MGTLSAIQPYQKIQDVFHYIPPHFHASNTGPMQRLRYSLAISFNLKPVIKNENNEVFAITNR